VVQQLSIYTCAPVGVLVLYILEGEGGDQLCSRAATGESLTDVSFANLPAHVLTEDDGITSEEWEQIVPGYSTFYPQSFREVIPYLLASLVHHRQYLRDLQVSHPRQPLFLQYIWTSGILDKVKEKVGAGCNRNPTSKMFATGVPPHLVLANRVAEMQAGIDVMREDIIRRIEMLPEELKISLLENFRLEGVLPITQLQIVQMMNDIKISLLSAIRQEPSGPQSVQQPCIAEGSGSDDVTGYSVWSWKNKFHLVPEDFIFPR
jgi:hypothetical protein